MFDIHPISTDDDLRAVHHLMCLRRIFYDGYFVGIVAFSETGQPAGSGIMFHHFNCERGKQAQGMHMYVPKEYRGSGLGLRAITGATLDVIDPEVNVITFTAFGWNPVNDFHARDPWNKRLDATHSHYTFKLPVIEAIATRHIDTAKQKRIHIITEPIFRQTTSALKRLNFSIGKVKCSYAEILKAFQSNKLLCGMYVASESGDPETFLLYGLGFSGYGGGVTVRIMQHLSTLSDEKQSIRDTIDLVITLCKDIMIPQNIPKIYCIDRKDSVLSAALLQAGAEDMSIGKDRWIPWEGTIRRDNVSKL